MATKAERAWRCSNARAAGVGCGALECGARGHPKPMVEPPHLAGDGEDRRRQYGRRRESVLHVLPDQPVRSGYLLRDPAPDGVGREGQDNQLTGCGDRRHHRPRGGTPVGVLDSGELRGGGWHPSSRSGEGQNFNELCGAQRSPDP